MCEYVDHDKLAEDVRSRWDTSSLSNVIHAAAPCPVDVKRRMIEWWGPVIYEYYAATEGGGTVVTMTILYASREARDAALRTDMEQGMAASYDRLDGLLGAEAPTIP